ncbi:MAG TPA: 4a-hydroxytetrahydrobiopterin dehydratase [Candidatus Thermoplasmatota archaeon]|nr:4a-hydroxytetrahydrobiopterin dehydratase [Candidatus Thermoplasmatota archaeon]
MAQEIRMPPGWRASPDGKRMGIEVETQDFLAALDLFREIGAVAEELEHHPDLHLERWNRVRIETYSHDVGRLTARDERLATRVHGILRTRGLAEDTPR